MPIRNAECGTNSGGRGEGAEAEGRGATQCRRGLTAQVGQCRSASDLGPGRQASSCAAEMVARQLSHTATASTSWVACWFSRAVQIARVSSRYALTRNSSRLRAATSPALICAACTSCAARPPSLVAEVNRVSRSASLCSASRLSAASWVTDACALMMASSLPARKRSSGGGRGAGAAAAAAALSAAEAWEDEAAGAGERAFRMSVPLVGLGVGAGDGQLLSVTPSW